MNGIPTLQHLYRAVVKNKAGLVVYRFTVAGTGRGDARDKMHKFMEQKDISESYTIEVFAKVVDGKRVDVLV